MSEHGGPGGPGTAVATPPGPAPGAKPTLRGWIHAAAAPLAIAAGIVLVSLAPTTAGKVSCAVFGVTSMLLFTISATYHLGRWSPRVALVLRHADHSNIFLIIAGTYTPLAVLLLSARSATILLVVVWVGSAVGLAANMLWIGAPRWLYVPVYVVLGCVCVAYLAEFWLTGGPTVVLLILGGGAAYILGAVVYGTRWPDPSPTRFGFHEVFHALTVVGFACHFIAIMTAALAA